MPNLTDIATVRQAIPRLNSVVDAEITRLIGEASDIIESYTKRTFGQGTFTETLDTTGTGQIFLRQRPVASITSVTVGLSGSTPTVLDPTAYRFNPTTGEVLGAAGSAGWFPNDPFGFNAGFWPFGGGFQSVRVVYVASFAAVPPAVLGRCLALISRCASGLANDQGLRSKTMGKVSYTIDIGMMGVLTAADRQILSPYRNYDLGSP